MTPEAIELTVPSGESGSTELTFGNLGPAGYSFEVFETPFDVAPAAPPDLAATADFSAPAAIGPLSIRSNEVPGQAQPLAGPRHRGSAVPTFPVGSCATGTPSATATPPPSTR